MARRPYPYLWLVRKKHSFEGRISLAADPATELVVEGFPRSANSYVVVGLHTVNPDLRIAHHLHAASQVIYAARMHIPIIILIRDPIDAVTSLKIYDEQVSMDSLFNAYVRFYTTIKSYRSSFMVSTFDTATQQLHDLIRAINDRFALALRTVPDTEDAKMQIFNKLDDIAWSRRGKDQDEATVSRRVSKPDSKRNLMKVQVQEKIASQRFVDLRNKACDVFREYTVWAEEDYRAFFPRRD